MHHNNEQGGFTLIELLVVIAIIGLLSSVVLASLNSARTKGRDARRGADIKQLQLAFELYYDENGQYPGNPGAAALCSTCIEGAENNASWADMAQFLSPLPLDPRYAGTTNGYRYRQSNVNGRQSYTMLIRLEKDSTWCSINTPPGHTSWNGAGGGNYPPCQF